MPGQTISHYRLVERLGAGGMGEVYLAEDDTLGRRVAVKILLQAHTRDDDRLRRFKQEAKAASALNHPNILTIHDVGEAEGQHFIVTEFVEGETLGARLGRAGALKPAEALEIATQAASALGAAHDAGIVHRDVKPDNLMIRRDGLVKVLDFGLAKLVAADASQSGDLAGRTTSLAGTEPGVVLGTVQYMSPEQARGHQVDLRTDIWSLGCVLYEMLAGRAPFEGDTVTDLLLTIVGSEPPPLGRYVGECPDELLRIVRKCMEKDRALRYQSMRELAIDLARLRRESDSISITTDKAASGKRRSAGGYALPIAALLILAGGGVAHWLSRSDASIRSIAVLPFANVNSDGDTEYLTDGITDNIIERLARLPGLKVMSHNAVFHYKGRTTDARTVGRELGVEAVLTGRLVKRDDAITINLELVNAKDNSHVWGEQYDGKLAALLALQREIPVDIADKLRLRLSGESKERLARAYTGDPQAYELYLRGRHAWETWSLDGAKRAVGYFEEAIRKDPDYALAYAGLADVMLWGRFPGPGLTQKEAHRRGREAATKALALDPQLGEAHTALGQVLLYDDWDFDGAEREFKLALELNPSYGEGHHAYSHLLLLQGRIDESYAESMKFLELDPVSEAPIGHLCYHYLYARRYDDAIAQCGQDLQLYPSSPQGETLAEAYYQKGMYRDAVEEYLKFFANDGMPADLIAEYRKAYEQSGIAGFYRHRLQRARSRPAAEQDSVTIAELYARLGEKDQAFEWLEKAYAQRADGVLRLIEDLGFDNLRSDPRYADLLKRIGLPHSR